MPRLLAPHPTSPQAQRHTAAFILVLAGIFASVQGASCRDFNLDDGASGGGRVANEPGGAAGAGGAAGDSGSSRSESGGAGREPENSAPSAGASGFGGDSDGAPGVPVPTLPVEVEPSSLSGLALWLDASPENLELSADQVWLWRDRSRHGNDATTTSSTARPLHVPLQVNERSVVMFDSGPSTLEVLDDASIRFGREPFTVAFVAEWRNNPTPKYLSVSQITYAGYGCILLKVDADTPYDGLVVFANAPSAYPTASAQLRLGVQLEYSTAFMTSSATNLNDGKYRLYVVQRTAPETLEERINGQAQHGVEIPADIDTSAVGYPLLIGGDTTRPFVGSLAELVMIKGPISEAELTGLEHYLMQKFAL